MNTLTIFRFILLTLVLSLSVFSAFGQDCPTLNVTGPSSDPMEGTDMTFVVNVSGGDKNVTPTYNWSLSAGTISSGQGTPVIWVDTSALGGYSVTATVEVWGYDRHCNTVGSWTASVRPKSEPSRKIDEYGKIRWVAEKARLDNFAIELQNDPATTAYIITYGGRKSLPTAARTASQNARKHLVKTRGILESRIVWIDGGYREEPATELWIMPQDSTPPTASPTVDPSEIKKPKKAVKKNSGKKS